MACSGDPIYAVKCLEEHMAHSGFGLSFHGAFAQLQLSSCPAFPSTRASECDSYTQQSCSNNLLGEHESALEQEALLSG